MIDALGDILKIFTAPTPNGHWSVAFPIDLLVVYYELIAPLYYLITLINVPPN